MAAVKSIRKHFLIPSLWSRRLPSMGTLLVPAFCIGLVALVWAALPYQIAYERDVQIAHREEEHDNLARLFEDHVRSMLAAASVALREVESQYRQQGTRLDLERYLDERPELRHYLNIAVVDRAGDVVLNRTPFSKPLSVRETESFQHHLNNPSLDLFIAKPRIGKASGRLTLFVTRRMNRPDGSFDGMTSVGVDPGHLFGFYDQTSLGAASVIMLIGRDGVVREMRSNAGAQAGQNMMQSPLFTTHLPAREAGHGIWSGMLDGVTRLYSYRSVKGFPLVVVVGSAKDVVLAAVEQRRRVYLWWAGGISVAILGFAVLVAMQSVRRKRYEEALRKHGLRFRRMVETSNDGFWVVDREGRLRDVNESYIRRSGYTRKELLGMRVSQLEAKETPEETAARIETVASEGAEVFETLHRAKDGAVWPVEVAVGYRSDNPGQMLCFLRDITERKRGERELQHKTELAQLLEQLARAANEAVSPEAAMEICLKRICEQGKWAIGRVASFGTVDPRHRPERSQWYCPESARFDAFIQFSDSREFDVTAARFIGLVLIERRPVWLADLTAVDKAKPGRLVKAVEAGFKAAFAFPVIVRGEVAAILEFFATETREPDVLLMEGTTGLASQFARLIERHQFEASRARLAAIVENANEAIFSRTLDGIVTSWNAGAEKMLGYTAAEAIGRPIAFTLPPDRPPNLAGNNEKVLRGETIAPHEATRLTKDGRVIDVLTSHSPIKDGAGNIVGASVILQDITALKLAEEARSGLEAQLREAQKLEAVGTLAGGIAHDFNNILGAIIGNAELARQDVGAGHRALVSLEEISKASQRAKELVQRILTFSRRRPQQLLVQPLRPVVEEAVKLLRATLPAGVELAAAMCETPVYVHADATQVQQVLLNLCTNAWHAMEGRAGRIEIGLEEVMLDAAAAGALSSGLQPGLHACVSVRDNGCGMDAATQARVFEPFFTTKAVDQGTGLGLSVVHGIVKAHHGAILLESAPGAGATFRIYFPAVAEPRAAVLPEAAAPGPVRGGGQHVLYVDDDEAMVFLVTRMLEGFGYRVSGHESAEDALAAVRATPGEFDLVVTDFNMPGLSGIDVAHELGRLRPELPVVITSGYITEALQANALQAGVRHIIYKPDTAAELCEVIQRLLTPACS